MRQIGFWGFTSLFFPFATALAAPGASSVPDEIQGHPYKRLIGSLIEVEGWKGFMPRQKSLMFGNANPLMTGSIVTFGLQRPWVEPNWT